MVKVKGALCNLCDTHPSKKLKLADRRKKKPETCLLADGQITLSVLRGP